MKKTILQQILQTLTDTALVLEYTPHKEYPTMSYSQQVTFPFLGIHILLKKEPVAALRVAGEYISVVANPEFMSYELLGNLVGMSTMFNVFLGTDLPPILSKGTRDTIEKFICENHPDEGEQERVMKMALLPFLG
jgi:hypothetical protein